MSERDETREAVARAIEPKCRAITGGANPLAMAVAYEFTDAVLMAMTPGSRFTVEGVECVVVRCGDKFSFGDRVRKIKGSRWQGRVVGIYSTELTPEGYAVESETETGSVQIYPASALEPVMLRACEEEE